MKISEFFILYGEPAEIIAKLGRKLWVLVFRILQAFRSTRGKPDKVYLVAPGITEEDLAELTRRAKFYAPALNSDKFVQRSDIDLPVLLSSVPFLIFGPRKRLLDW